MIAGLPWTAWLLLVVAVGLPLGLELVFLRRARRRRAPDSSEDGA